MLNNSKYIYFFRKIFIKVCKLLTVFYFSEPGYYQDGEFGIRIEDIVQIVPASSEYNFNGRGALTFKTITMCPKQTKMIKKNLLNAQEVFKFITIPYVFINN